VNADRLKADLRTYAVVGYFFFPSFAHDGGRFFNTSMP